MTAKEALAALGKTDRQVAETLRKGGYRGTPMTMCGCPVAEYLSDKCARIVEVGVFRSGTGMCARFLGAKDDMVPVPGAVSRFIRRFDSGDYEDLCIAANPPPGDSA